MREKRQDTKPQGLDQSFEQSFFSFMDDVGVRSSRSLTNFGVSAGVVVTLLTGAAQGSGRPVAHAESGIAPGPVPTVKQSAGKPPKPTDVVITPSATVPASPTDIPATATDKIPPKKQTQTAEAQITPSVTNTAVPASPTNEPASPTNSVIPSITHTETIPASPTLKPRDQTRTAVAEITPSVTNTDTAVPASPTNIPSTPTNSVTPSITHTETIPASPTKDRDATKTAQAEDKDATRTAQAEDRDATRTAQAEDRDATRTAQAEDKDATRTAQAEDRDATRTAQAIRKTPTSTNTDTPEPTQEDTPEPTQEDTPEPTQEDTPEPTQEDTPEPTQEDTPEPTSSPTPSPTATNTKPKPTNPIPTYNSIIQTFTPTSSSTRTATEVIKDLVSASPTGTTAKKILEQVKPNYEVDSVSPYIDIYSDKARQEAAARKEFYSIPEAENKFMRKINMAHGRLGTGDHLSMVYQNILGLQENLSRSASNEDSKRIIETYKRQIKEWDEMPKEYRAELEEIIRTWENTQREIDLLLQQIRAWEEAHKAHIKLYEAQRKQWLADRNRKPNSGTTYRPVAVAE